MIASQYFGRAAHQPPIAGSGEGHHHRLPHRGARCFQLQKRRLSQPEYARFPSESGELAAATCGMCSANRTQRALLLLDDALELCYDVMKPSLGRSALLTPPLSAATLYRASQRLKAGTEPGYSLLV